VEDRPVGFRFVRSRGEWPLHITLVPWFTIQNEALINSCLEEVASTNEAFNVTVGALDMFGTHNDVPVNVIHEQEKIKELHMGLIASLRNLGATFIEERWIDHGYHAHITRHESQGKWRDQGDTERVNDYHLVRLVDGNVCEIVKRFVLGPT
jgi:2'-5' RNA ligase